MRLTRTRQDNNIHIFRLVANGEIKVEKCETDDTDWVEFEQPNRVNARWVFRREVARRYRPALTVIDTDDAKFDANAGRVLAGEQVRKLREALRDIDRRESLAELSDLATVPSSRALV